MCCLVVVIITILYLSAHCSAPGRCRALYKLPNYVLKISKMALLAVNIKKLEKEELRQKSYLDRETYLNWQARLYEISSLPWSSLENISPRGVLLTLNCLSVKYSFHFSYLPEINLKCQKNYFWSNNLKLRKVVKCSLG